jgi:hypothetical protein
VGRARGRRSCGRPQAHSAPGTRLIEVDCQILVAESQAQRLLVFTAPPTPSATGSPSPAEPAPHQSSVAPGARTGCPDTLGTRPGAGLGGSTLGVAEADQ